MATNKTDIRTFSQFRGLDLTRDDVTRDPNSASVCTNLERLDNGSLRPRRGYKMEAQPLYIRDIFNYVYTDSDGVVQEEIVGIGSLDVGPVSNIGKGRMQGTLFRLKKRQGEFTINYSGGNTWGVSLLSTGTHLEFKLIDNGVDVLTSDIGTGLVDDGGNKDIKTLCDEINGVTNFSIIYPKTLVVNGNQTGVTTLTVQTALGVDFTAVGEWLEFDSSFSKKEMLQFTRVVSGTSVELGGVDSPSRDYTDNQVLGHARYPAAILELTDFDSSVTGGSSVTINYSYWEPIPCPLFTFPYTGSTFPPVAGSYPDYPVQNLQTNYGDNSYKPISYANDNNCLYFTSSYVEKLDLQKIINGSDPTDFEGGLWKYDGTSVYLAGPVNIVKDIGTADNFMTVTEDATGSALQDFTYKYQLSILRQDARDNVSESFLEYIITYEPATDPNDATITIRDRNGSPSHSAFGAEFFNLKRTQASTTASFATTSFSVPSGHEIRTGDYIWFEDNSNVIQKRKVTGWTDTTITLNESATVTSGNAICTALARVWRTRADAGEFFLTKEAPLDVDLSKDSFSITDDTTDANLGIKLTSVKQETLQFNFPRMNCIAEHQGYLIGGGGPTTSQNVLWEDPLYFESLDYARNIRTVPTMNSGAVNGLMVQSRSSILITKKDSLYEGLGALGDNTFEVNRIVESSYGVEGVAGLTVLEDIIFGAGRLGLWGISENQSINLRLGEAILEVFSQAQVNIENTIAYPRIGTFFDSNRKWLHVFLPDEIPTGSDPADNLYAHSTSRYFVFQLPKLVEQPLFVSEYTFTDSPELYPSAGLLTSGGQLYHASRGLSTSWYGYLFQRLEGEVARTSGGDTSNQEAQDFYDNALPYTWELVPAYEDLGEPEYDKAWQEFIMYQLQSDYWLAPASITFVSYRDWDSSKTDSTRTLTLSDANTDEYQVTFDKNVRAKRRTFSLSGSVSGNPPVISGYTMTADDQKYKKSKYGRNR